MWTITSSASISTQSAAGSPSIRTFRPKSLFDLVGKLNGHRRDLAGRAARRDHHMIGDVRLAGERDGHDLLRLVVVERLEDELVEIFDVDGSAAGIAGGGFSGMFGQGVSWRTMAGRNAARAPARGCARRYQWGSCARMAVAEVGSGGRRRKMIAGALHSVHCFAWLEGWTNLRASPSRAPRGQLNHNRAGESPQSALRGLSPSNHAISENLAGCRFRATR